jgi:hypothetical protein
MLRPTGDVPGESFLGLSFGFATGFVRMGRPQMNLIALANCPTKAERIERIGFYVKGEVVNVRHGQLVFCQVWMSFSIKALASALASPRVAKL